MDKANKFLHDLGLGKETNFKYPWRPDGSPDFCEEAENFLAGSWNPLGFPEKKCNEFIFTRA